MTHERITKLKEIFEKDRSQLHSKYPDQALPALKDQHVVEAIEKQLDRGLTLRGIESLGYSFLTGLNHICFEFESSQGIGIEANAILVIMNSSCDVVGVVANFDSRQPNPVIPPLPDTTDQGPLEQSLDRGELPFVLARPSATSELSFTKAELYPLEVRSKKFFERLAPNGSLLQVQTVEGSNSPFSTLTSVDVLADKGFNRYPDAQTDGANDDEDT